MGNGTFGEVELNTDRGQRLADFIVQLARNRSPLFFLRVQHLRRRLLQLARNARVALQLRAKARLEPAGVRAGQQQRAEADDERQADAVAALGLGRAIDRGNVGLLLDECTAVDRLNLLRNRQRRLAVTADVAAQRVANLRRGPPGRVGQHLERPLMKLLDFTRQTLVIAPLSEPSRAPARNQQGPC